MNKKVTLKVLAFSCMLAFQISCSKNNSPIPDVQTPTPSQALELPSLLTNPATTVTTSSIGIGGKIEKNGNVVITDRGVCLATSPNPTIANFKTGTISLSGSGEFTSLITGLNSNTTYYIRAYAEIKSGAAYGNELIIKTIEIGLAVISTDPSLIIGKNIARVGGTVLEDGGSTITSRGICYSTSPNPTVGNSKVISEEDGRDFTCIMTELSSNTTYYTRAFATNARGTGYGTESSFKTITGGNVTYTIRRKDNPTEDEADAYRQITTAMNTAVQYYNTYTTISKVITIEYVPSVPTADGSFTGNIRFGTGRVYMNPGTCLHEISHTIGVGTTSIWWSGQGLIVNGKYTGQHANAIHRWITKDQNATLLEDGEAHFKPYQFNVPNAPQTPLDYIYHTLIMEGMKKDGLPIN